MCESICHTYQSEHLVLAQKYPECECIEEEKGGALPGQRDGSETCTCQAYACRPLSSQQGHGEQDRGEQSGAGFIFSGFLRLGLTNLELLILLPRSPGSFEPLKRSEES